MAEKSIVWDLISNDRASATNAKVGASFDRLEHSTSNMGATFGKVATAAKVLGGAAIAAGGLAVISGTKTLASLETTQIGFTSLLGSAKKANDYITWMKKFAASTPFDLAGLTDSARKLIGVGVSAKESKVILQDFGDTAGAVGMDADHFSMAMLAVSQSISAGHIKLGDMNQLMNDGIPIWKLLSEAIGKPVPKIQAMISKGDLLSKDVMPKLLSVMHKDYGGAMAKQSMTLTGLWSTLMDTINLGMAGALQPLEGLMKHGLSGAIAVTSKALSGLPKDFTKVKDAAKGMHLDKLIGDAKDLKKKATGWVQPIIDGLKGGIGQGNWAGFWPLLESKIFSGANKAGQGGTQLVQQLGKMMAGIDWVKIGDAVGAQAFPFAVGFVNSLFTGVITAFKKHPWETVLSVISVIPIGRVAGIFGKALKPGILKGVLDGLEWIGGKVEGPVWKVIKIMARGFMTGLDHAAPELRGAVKDLLETGLLKILYAGEGVGKAARRPFELIGQAAGRAVGGVIRSVQTAGMHIIQGLVRGIEQMGPRVMAAVKWIANLVPQGVKKALEIFSPSRVMAALGGHTMQGYINGIRGKKKEMHAALEDVKSVLSTDISKWKTIYSDQKSKLKDLESSFKSLKASIKDAFNSTSITDRGSNFLQVMASYKTDITGAKQAAANLKKLKKMGLSTALLTQLAQGGQGAVGLENSIISSGKSGVSDLNKANKQLNSYGNAAGTEIANATYAAAIKAETKEVKNLKKGLADLEKAMDKVNHALRHPGHVDAAKLRAALYKILRQAGALSGS